jgi:nicotinate-nucleotide--dimethylbenzimidazole phosphoribosyltransferase
VTTWLQKDAPSISAGATAQATARQSQLTKPPGSLGRLEEVALRLAGLQDTDRPVLDRLRIVVFAADHGVVQEQVSAYPQSVTLEMVRNFARGGAAISVLSKQLGACLEVVNVGTVQDIEEIPGVISQRVAPGTANFCHTAAMTSTQLEEALAVGRAAAMRAIAERAQLYIGGEMGIGNSTSASALSCALLGLPAEQLTGSGTGLDRDGVVRKILVIERALALHRSANVNPFDALRCLGGLEIAALVASYISCAQHRLPVLVDGFIAGVAALIAVRINPSVAPWFIYSHLSAEPAHAHVLQALNQTPLMALDMRLGEASGAAVVVPLLRLACALHNNMATFVEAQVSVACTSGLEYVAP